MTNGGIDGCVDEGIVILEDTTPIRVKMFCTKVITQNNFVLICSDPSF